MKNSPVWGPFFVKSQLVISFFCVCVETRPPKAKLECVSQYNLFGCVVSMQSINLANSPRDALLLAFSEAKLSIVEYDPESHDLKTLSLHYFEEEDMKVKTKLQGVNNVFVSRFFFMFRMVGLTIITFRLSGRIRKIVAPL